MEGICDAIGRWATFVLGAIVAQANDILGILAVFIVVFVLDLISGLAKSIATGVKIESYKLRWSFAKTCCYLLTFAFTMFVGIAIGAIEGAGLVLKTEVYVALWVELLSITENMTKIFPGVSLWGFLHHMLAFEWIKKVNGLSNYLKEQKKDVEPSKTESNGTDSNETLQEE